MATKLHSSLSGSDLHPNAIDGTTGTELTTASETIYDARWVKGKVYVSTAADTVANTTTTTEFAPKYTIPANSLTPGKMIRVRAWGRYGTLSASPGSWVTKLYDGRAIYHEQRQESSTGMS